MRVLLCLVLLVAVLSPPAVAEDAGTVAAPAVRCHPLITDQGATRQVCIREATYVADVCGALARYADAWRLPRGFLARLVWQESRFDPRALSQAGAQGIAQFMPSTARLRGLRDAFDPAEALARSAEYLRFLADKYGNLGLAAAAYNSGEGRVSRWLAAGGMLPSETRNYVRTITGRSVETWLDDAADAPDFDLDPALPFVPACLALAAGTPAVRLGPAPAELKPWGVLLAQDFSRDVAEQRFERVRAAHRAVLADEPMMIATGRNPNFGPRPRHFAMVGRDTRADAEALCARLVAAGGACIVRRN